MMGSLLFLRAGWQPISMLIAILAIFYCGYHLRVLQDESADEKNLVAQVTKNDKIDSTYNDEVSLQIQSTENLNHKLKVVYEEPSYRCPIPTGGLRLIRQANR